MQSRLEKLIVIMFQDLYEHILDVARGEVGTVEFFNNKTYARHGLDVILRRNGQFQVLESNRRSFQATDCPSEFEVAPRVCRDELNLVGIPVYFDSTSGKIENPEATSG